MTISAGTISPLGWARWSPRSPPAPTIMWFYQWHLKCPVPCDKADVGGLGGGDTGTQDTVEMGTKVPVGLFTCKIHISRSPVLKAGVAGCTLTVPGGAGSSWPFSWGVFCIYNIKHSLLSQETTSARSFSPLGRASHRGTECGGR